MVSIFKQITIKDILKKNRKKCAKISHFELIQFAILLSSKFPYRIIYTIAGLLYKTSPFFLVNKALYYFLKMPLKYDIYFIISKYI